ncbi:MAG: sulfite exporter TauE/SafE family protein [Acidobacteriota bacterium]|nr:sulfite exporter TauE/SafE family protein [Acidobacteriota bacterium]
MQTGLVLLLGLLVGALSGVVGIGGGLFLVPGLVYLFGMDQHKAQGTSLGALLGPIGLLAFWEYWKAGNVDGRLALLIAIGFLIGGWFGGIAAQHVPDLLLRRGFALLLVGVGVRMLF